MVHFTVTLLSPTSMRFLVLFDEAVHLDVTLDRVGDATPFANPLGSRLPDSGHSCNVQAAALPSQQVRSRVIIRILIHEAIHARTHTHNTHDTHNTQPIRCGHGSCQEARSRCALEPE